jgi:hypothetical protein
MVRSGRPRSILGNPGPWSRRTAQTECVPPLGPGSGRIPPNQRLEKIGQLPDGRRYRSNTELGPRAAFPLFAVTQPTDTPAPTRRIIASQIAPLQQGPILMRPEALNTSSFLRPCWKRLAIPSWLLSLLVLAVLAARFYSAFGPPQANILFLLHILVMWTLPFLFLTRQGRRDIGLRRQGIAPVALVLCSLAGVAVGLFFFWIGMALYGN